MSFIADISFERPDKKDTDDKYRYVKIGALWFDREKHEASAMLHAVRVGSFVARPRNQDDAPYLEGNMCVKTGTFVEENVTKGRYMTVGYIQTKESNGVVYFGQILCDPTPILVLGRVKELLKAMVKAREAGKSFDLDDFPMSAVFIPIFLSDRNKKQETRKDNDGGLGDENLPF